VDFLIVNLEDNKQVEPHLILGRPFMATTKMEINMRDGSITMMVLGKKLQLDVYDDKSPYLYSSNDPNYCFDEDMMKQVKESLQIIRSRPLHNKVQGGSKTRKGGKAIWLLKEKPRPFKYPSATKKDSPTNSCHFLSSNFDDTGTLKSNGGNLREDLNLGGKKKKEASLRKIGDEKKVENHPRLEGDQGKDVGPNDEGMDQHGVTPP